MNANSIRNILVPVDLSEPSLNALNTAVAIAKKNKAGIHLLYVHETLAEFLDGNTEGYNSLQVNTDVLLALAGTIKHEHDILPTVTETEGHVLETIIKTSISISCDLIVMGKHGASGLRDGFIGTNAYNVIKYSTCPVLAVPPERKFTSFRKAVFPIRALPGALRGYDMAAHLLASDCVIDVLGLSNSIIERTGVLDKIANEMREWQETKKFRITTAWAQGSQAAYDILQYAQQNNAELVVLTPVLDGVSKNNFIGPHAQKVIHHSRLPVLNIKKIRVPEKSSVYR